MKREERLLALEQQARNRAVKGWAFRDLPRAENDAIRVFLAGGPCPERYLRGYALAREQLGLGIKDWYEAFAEAAMMLVPGWDATVDLTEEQERYCEQAADSKAYRPQEER